MWLQLCQDVFDVPHVGCSGSGHAADTTDTTHITRAQGTAACEQSARGPTTLFWHGTKRLWRGKWLGLLQARHKH
jgi:hypothetical protein